ncbi:MAG: bifunctional (p)ppGpp synthetase/guanosine-3',5'-bis(diphosphate) 3'-pyrophosphohydrolase, partial [Clostridia bacterium]|nr:bifunctional (p)ppGpp synthetase/guanosine-3',5'-bis(diphosphate) 3'-pyrophosphohydrolase [Clostridia bacterium]
MEKAIKYATDAHEGQKRKLIDAPYILHPMETAAIVSRITCDEDVVCAAILHDVAEDTGRSIDEIERLFGKRVAELVGAETEDKRTNLPPEATWRVRKEETLAHLRQTEDRAVKILWLADKLSNMRSVYNAYLRHGDGIWREFHEKDKEKQRWYYASVADALRNDFKGFAA